MTVPLLSSENPITLVGGGQADVDDVRLALSLAPICAAADGGAHLALEAGVTPAAVIGDMDSISCAARDQIPPAQFHHIAEQDSTDFDKALRHLSAPVVVAVGFAGGQIDHGLSVLHTLVQRPDRPVVVLAQKDIVFLCPARFALEMPAGTRVSLFPMGPVRGRSVGLHWPIDGIDFAPGVRAGTSNRATGNITLEMEAPNMLCILPRALIQPVVSALAALPKLARWPVRAG